VSEAESRDPKVPSAEELVDELRKAKVEDFLVHTCSLLASFGFGKLAPDVRDLEQARVSIEALRALQPLLPEAARRDLHSVVSSLQLAYAEGVSASQAAGSDPGPGPEEAAGAAPPAEPE
jgi:hypothetical protein